MAEQGGKIVFGDAVGVAGPNQPGSSVGEFNFATEHIKAGNGPCLEAVSGVFQFLGQQFDGSFLNNDLLLGQEHVVISGANVE